RSARLTLLRYPFALEAGRRRALVLRPGEPYRGDLPSLALVRDGHERVARRRHAGESLDLDRVGGAGDLDFLAGGIDQRADASGVRADHDRVALAQAPVLDQRGGHRTPASVETAFDDDTLGGAAGVGLELEDLGLERGD